jgi:hypothetical protein
LNGPLRFSNLLPSNGIAGSVIATSQTKSGEAKSDNNKTSHGWSVFTLILDDRKKGNCKYAKRPALRFLSAAGRGEESRTTRLQWFGMEREIFGDVVKESRTSRIEE